MLSPESEKEAHNTDTTLDEQMCDVKNESSLEKMDWKTENMNDWSAEKQNDHPWTDHIMSCPGSSSVSMSWLDLHD